MIKIIFISFILLRTHYSCESIREDDVCKDPVPGAAFEVLMRQFGVCGTDGVNYIHYHVFECAHKSEYGKTINLQMRHKGKCWIWEEYGYETYTVLSISLVLLILIGVCWYMCRAKRAVLKRDKTIPMTMIA